MASWWSRIRLPNSAGSDARSFDALVLPHLHSGYNLARWLLRDDSHAEDVVQEAAMRALRYFDALRGDDARAWFLGIVRNACFDHLGRGSQVNEYQGMEEGELENMQVAAGQVADDPIDLLDLERQRARIDDALRALPALWREVIVLRELEELDYADIARVAGIPIGTVMSRLSRARARLRVTLAQYTPNR